MCEFGVLDVFGYTPTEPHGLTSLLYRRQPPLGSLRSARYASPLSVTPGGLLQGHRAPPIYRNIFTLPFFEHAKEAKVIADNPAATMKETRVEEGKKEEPLPEIEQVKRIIEHIRNEPLSVTGEESADFLSFLAGAGIGNGEAAALLVQDVDWKKNLIHFRLT
jgi:hypothetical protein